MIYLVDNTIDAQGASPREILFALERLRPGLEVVVERFHEVSLQRVNELKPSHIILSGQSHPWNNYTAESQRGVYEIIHQARQPILGICGGHQQLALAYNAPVSVMRRLAP